MTEKKHPIQPLVKDHKGIIRFKKIKLFVGYSMMVVLIEMKSTRGMYHSMNIVNLHNL